MGPDPPCAHEGSFVFSAYGRRGVAEAKAAAVHGSGPSTGPGRGRRQVVVGLVTGDRMDKTRSVTVERFVRHAKYGKYLKRVTVCKVHDEKNEARQGDRVEIMETRPLSRTKRWRLLRVVSRAPAATPVKGAEPS